LPVERGLNKKGHSLPVLRRSNSEEDAQESEKKTPLKRSVIGLSFSPKGRSARNRHQEKQLGEAKDTKLEEDPPPQRRAYIVFSLNVELGRGTEREEKRGIEGTRI